MANFVHDTFTISGGLTDLGTQHVGETGADWTAHPVRANSPSSFLIAPGQVRMRETNNWFYASGVPASADYDVEADFILLTDSGSDNGPAVVGRMDTTAANGYEGRADYTGDVYEIRKVVSGVVTTLDSVSTPAWSARTDTIKLEMRGTALKLYVGGVEQLSVTDSDISAAGRAGLLTHGIHGSSTGTHIDNFDADDAAGGGATETIVLDPIEITLDVGGTVGIAVELTPIAIDLQPQGVTANGSATQTVTLTPIAIVLSARTMTVEVVAVPIEATGSRASISMGISL